MYNTAYGHKVANDYLNRIQAQVNYLNTYPSEELSVGEMRGGAKVDPLGKVKGAKAISEATTERKPTDMDSIRKAIIEARVRTGRRELGKKGFPTTRTIAREEAKKAEKAASASASASEKKEKTKAALAKVKAEAKKALEKAKPKGSRPKLRAPPKAKAAEPAKKGKGKGKKEQLKEMLGGMKFEPVLPGSDMSGFGKDKPSKKSGSDKRKKRGELIKKIMKERGCKLGEASRIIKQQGLL